ncbi:MAG: hypothetical protein GWO24_16075, partial [Akkermansiaceae bacterium]|nr:hypothetical protein [Akkermansiaceae bacterium]
MAAGAAEQAAPSEQSDPQTSEPILQESAAEASVDSPVVEPERETGFDDIPRIPDTNPAPEDDTSGETIMAEPPSTQTLGVESQKPVVEADSQPTEAGSLEQETAESLQREEEAAEPDSVEPPAVEPETFEPEPVEFEPVEPESVEPGSAEPETVELESVESEAAETEITEPVITEPEAIEPEPAEPEYFESAAA